MSDPVRSHFEVLIAISEAEGDVTLLLRDDRLKVRMSAIRGTGEHPLTARTITRLLDSKKIIHGRLDKAISQAVEDLDAPFARINEVLVAEGTPAQHGENARLEPLYDPDHPSVTQGQAVARRLAPTPGQAGKDVFGQAIAPSPGQSFDVRCGDGIRFDRETDQYLAENDGFVTVTGNSIALSQDFRVDILDEGFEARASFERAPFEARELLDHLALLGITHGIEQRAIGDAAARGTAENLLIASGQRAKPGEDAKAEYLFFRQDAPSSSNTDETNPLAMFDPGKPLLRLTPAKQGEPGKDIFSQEQAVETVRDIVVKAGDNVACTERDGVLIYSPTLRGAPILSDGTLSVTDHIKIKGDLTPFYGNLRFEGNITIGGNVPNGYRIQTDGDLHVHGVINDANIDVGGEMHVDSGFMGGKAFVGGSLTAKYIDKASLHIAGDIRVANEIIGATIDCLGHIEAPQAVLRGGCTSALKGLNINVIGSDSRELRTDVIAGKDARLIEARKRIKPQLTELENEQKQLNEKVHRLVPDRQQIPHLGMQQRDQVRQMLQRLSEISGQITALTEQLEAAEARAREDSDPHISVNKAIYPGTMLQIADSETTISREITGPAYLVERDGEIIIERG